MIRFNMHSIYDHYPNRHPVAGEPFIECYSDNKVMDCKKPGPKNIAWMLEPRSMINGAYEYVKYHADYFRYIFTHDTELLKLPNAYPFVWAEVWLTTDTPKTKGISICSSFKNWCPLHNARLELAKGFESNPKVDVYFGDWNNPKIPNVQPADYLERYKFSIIIENDIDGLWYTEKILNCFSTKTVPIYVGSPTIGVRFNADGIIRVDDWHKIPEIVEHLDIDAEYDKRRAAIEDNFGRLDYYRTPWKERFVRDYAQMLEGLQNE